jgi:hypothetical protein
LARIPLRYREARLETLTACQDSGRCFASLDLQSRVITLLQRKPDGSYCFLAPAGFGKSHLMAALFRRAVEAEGAACYFAQGAELVRGFREIECGADVEPYLCLQVIRRAIEQGHHPHIFLDELEKVPTYSQFTWAMMSEFFDGLYRLCDNDSRTLQLCVASNLNREEFTEFWGSAVLRRIQELCRVLDFFEVATVE